jgi:hypothetical protein
MSKKPQNRLWILMISSLFWWGCAKPPTIPFVGNWENTHPMKGGQFITQIVFEPSGSGQVQQISHMTAKSAKKISDSVVIRPMHWHSDGEHYVILLYQPEGSGQVRLEWSISNDGKVLSLIHADNSTDVYYRPGAQGSAGNTVAESGPVSKVSPSEEATDRGDSVPVGEAEVAHETHVPVADVGQSDREKRIETTLESL